MPLSSQANVFCSLFIIIHLMTDEQDEQRQIFHKAFQMWADVSSVTFSEVSSPSDADIKIRQVELLRPDFLHNKLYGVKLNVLWTVPLSAMFCPPWNFPWSFDFLRTAPINSSCCCIFLAGLERKCSLMNFC